MAQQIQTALAILRLKQTQQKVRLSRSTIYALAKQDKFPKPILLGARSVGWIESEIDAWIADRIDASRTNRTTR